MYRRDIPSSASKGGAANAAVQIAVRWLAGWCLPVPVVAIKALNVLLVSAALGSGTVQRWIDRKRGHRD